MWASSGHGTEAKREAGDWRGMNKIESMHLSTGVKYIDSP
jgi:hypothetical protein